VPSPVEAAEPTKTELAAARDLFARAEHDEDAGRWADAIEKLRRAASVKMTPGIRFHIALCEEKLGQLVAALGDYTATEASARSEGNKEVLDAIAEPLAALRARIPTLTIVAPPDPKDAEVSLDGGPLPVGLLGTPVPVEVGPHVVGAHAAGRLPFSSNVTVSEKQSLTVEVRFPAPALSPEVAPPSEPRQSASGASSNLAPILTTVGAVAVVGFGVGAYFISGSKQSSAETACRSLVPSTCESDFQGGVRTWDAVAFGAWVAGAGLGALSIYLWTHPSKSEKAGAPSALHVGPGSIRFVSEF